MLEPAATRARVRQMAIIAAVAATGLVVDLSTKAWAWETLRRHPPKRLIRGFFHLEFAFNTGAAFGFLRDANWSRWAFVAVTVAAVAYVLRLGWRWAHGGVLAPVAVGLLVGGALGNLHDRLFREMLLFDRSVRHGVVDFLVIFYWPKHRWPAFNVADVLLLLGMVLLVWALWRVRERGPR